MTTKEKVIDLVNRLLQLSVKELKVLESDIASEKIAAWDSAKHVEIIVAIEDEFDLEIEPRDIARLSTVPKIVAYLESK